MKIISKYSLITIFIIPLILTCIWFNGGYIMGTGESALPFYNLYEYEEITRYSWNPDGLGSANGITVAGWPFYFLGKQLINIGLSEVFIEVALFYVLFVTAGFSICLLIKQMFPKLDNVFVLSGMFFYWFNPFATINVWNRFLYNYMVFWALLPFALFLFIKGLNKRSYVYAIFTSLSTVVFSYALTSIPFNIILWLVFIYTAGFFLYIKRLTLGFTVKYLIITAVTYFLFNFWWVGQFVTSIFASSFAVGFNSFSTVGNLSSLRTISEKHGDILNLIALLPGDFGASWMHYYNPPIFYGFILFFSFVLLFTIKKIKIWQVLYFGGLYFLSIFLMKGAGPPFGELFSWFFSNISAFQVFRNPFEKFGFILSLSYSVLFGFAIAEFTKIIKSEKVKNIFLIIVSFYTIIFLGYPFWTKKVFTSNDTQGKTRSYEVKVPEYYKEANKWLQEHSDNSRFISLPIGGEGMTYTWDKPYSGVELSATLFNTPNISFNTTTPYFNVYVSELSKYQLSNKAFGFYPFTSIKYILLRDDIAYKERKVADPKSILSRFDSDENYVNKVYENGALTIYDLNQKYIWPKIYTTNNFYFSNSPDLYRVTKYTDGFPTNKHAIFKYDKNSEAVEEKFDNKAIIIFPDKVYCPIDANTIRNYTEDGVIARLFYVKHLPDSNLFPLVLLKEKLSSPPRSDHEAWLIYQNGLLGKRAVEVYKLAKGGADRNMIKRAEERYAKHMEFIKNDISAYIGSTGPIGELLRNSLLYQEWLFMQFESNLSLSYVQMYIHDVNLKPAYLLPESEEGMEYIVYSYNVLNDSFFQINFFEKESDDRLYIDGKRYEKNDNLNNSDIFFEKGVHEIALSVNTSDENSIVLNKEEVVGINEDNEYGWIIDVPDEPVEYKLSFDYKFISGDEFQISFEQNIDSENSKIFSQKISNNENNKDWKNYKTTFTTSNGTEEGWFSFDKAVNKQCRKSVFNESCVEVVPKYSVEIRNLLLEYNSTPEVVLENTNALIHIDKPQTITLFEKINPAKYVVHVKKTDKIPEMLVFSELYSSEWKAEYSDGIKLPDEDHFLVNVYANGWLIDREGNYEITISYASQKMLEVGKTISLYSTIIGICFVLVMLLKEKMVKHV